MAVGLAAIMATAPAMRAFGIRWNATASIPVGIYVARDSPAQFLTEFSSPNEDIVSVCLDGPWSWISIERGYRPDAGNCPDGRRPLAKPVIATEGDIVVVSDKGISVNGKLLPNTVAHSADERGRPLAAWPKGRYEVEPGEVWVASSYNDLSFDSRYFGPVPTKNIQAHLKPFLTWR